jgi:translation initiation factor 2 beta subunit (eIF-2beta)/eIF-5
MNGLAAAQEEPRNVVSVFLTCIRCGKVEEINVFRERDLPRKVYWECLDCQKSEGRRDGEPRA